MPRAPPRHPAEQKDRPVQVGKAHDHPDSTAHRGQPRQGPRKIHSGSNTQFRLQTIGAGKNNHGAGEWTRCHCCASTGYGCSRPMTVLGDRTAHDDPGNQKASTRTQAWMSASSLGLPNLTETRATCPTRSPRAPLQLIPTPTLPPCQVPLCLLPPLPASG